MYVFSNCDLLTVQAAKAETRIADYLLAGRLSREVSVGYEARLSSLSHLQKLGMIFVDGENLILGDLLESPELNSQLLASQEVAWKIVDEYPERNRKFNPDDKSLELIGLEGELFVFSELQRLLPPWALDEIDHVSKKSDLAGFDISAPSIKNPSILLKLEIKCSSRPGDNFRFFLSRNEYEKAKLFENWFLVLVSKSKSKIEIFGHLSAQSLINYYPNDVNKSFRWSLTEGYLTRDDVWSGLP